MIYFVRQRKDIPFTRLFWLFASFILACGTVHLVEAIIFWYPIYRVSGLVKLSTAVVSWATVIALIRMAPSILQLPSLAASNRLLNQEINQRRQTERDERALKARYEALLSGTRSIVWTTDPEGNFVTPQDSWQRYTGQTWEQHQGSGWLIAIHEFDREELLSRWNDSLRRKSRYTARQVAFGSNPTPARAALFVSLLPKAILDDIGVNGIKTLRPIGLGVSPQAFSINRVGIAPRRLPTKRGSAGQAIN